MRQRRLNTLVATAAIGSLLLAACGGTEEGGTGQGGDGDDKVVKIGFIAPLSGDLSALGLGMRNSVELAIREANAAKKIEGWTIEFAPEDDTAKPDIGAQVATKLASDSAVVGVVGTLNSSVAQQVQPILDRADVVMCSPANTNPTLTQGEGAQKKRPYQSYVRVATTDAVQGPFAAQYLYNEANVKRAAIIHDKKVYGQGLQAAFAAEFKRLGGTIVATETINPGDRDFAAVISKVQAANPEAVYYGGEYPEAAPLSRQIGQKGLDVPVMGGDGIYDPTFIQNGGRNNDLATSVGAPAESLPSAKGFIDAYNGANFKDPYGAYGPQAYDCANAIIEAMAKVLPGKDAVDDSVKSAIVDAMGDVSLDGATGRVAFDEFGDNVTKILTVYKVEGGAWKPVKSGEPED